MRAIKSFSEIQKRFEDLGLPRVDIPNLLAMQVESFDNFLQKDIHPKNRRMYGLQEVFAALFPIEDAKGLFKLEFLDYAILKEKYSVEECIERNLTYQAPVKARLRLYIYDEEQVKERKDSHWEEPLAPKNIIEQEVFLGEIPLITRDGTFIINGAERVIISQLHRSPGVFFTKERHTSGKQLFTAKVIPYNGSWLEFSFDSHDAMYIHIDKRRKLPVSVLLRAIGYSADAEIRKVFYVRNPQVKMDDAVGKFLFEDIYDSENGEVFCEAGKMITEELVQDLSDAAMVGIDTISVPVSIKVEKALNRVLSTDVFGRREKLLYEAGTQVTDQVINDLKDNNILLVQVEPLDSDINSVVKIVENTLAKDPTKNQGDALKKIYNLIRPGEEPTEEDAKDLVERMFFNEKRYNLGEVGRHKLNKRLHLEIDPNLFTLTRDDIVSIVTKLMDVSRNLDDVDDIDHLANRRLRTVGELLQEQYESGLMRVARIAIERMSIANGDELTVHDLINSNALIAVVQAFFLTGQLSQFMEQTNPLAALTHKRRLSALGPGGLTRDRAGFEVRDVHYSHYGRICPVETPEGPNIGLISSPAVYSRINRLGFLDTPYIKISSGHIFTQEVQVNEIALSDNTEYFLCRETSVMLQPAKTKLSYEIIRALFRARVREIAIKITAKSKAAGLFLTREVGEYPVATKLTPEIIEECAKAKNTVLYVELNTKAEGQTLAEDIFIGFGAGTKIDDYVLGYLLGSETPLTVEVGQVDYLDPAEEDNFTIAQTNVTIAENLQITDDLVFARQRGEFIQVRPTAVQYMDVAPQQMVSVSAALIPFLEHDDANRALMGSNMQRQAVPLLNPQQPMVGTGMEHKVALESGSIALAPFDAVVTKATAEYVELKRLDARDDELDIASQNRIYLKKYTRSNQDTTINQRPIVKRGDKVLRGEPVSDGPCIENNRLALGQNLTCAFMPWYGFNYEDAIILSERVAREDLLTSIYIEELEVLVRNVKNGKEELAQDIPNVPTLALRNLDKTGIIRVGSVVKAGDIIVGKITPKSVDIDPSPEETLMRALFGDRAGDFTNTSLKAKPGMEGVVINVKVFSRREDVTDFEEERKSRSEKLKEEHSDRKRKIEKFLKERLHPYLIGEKAKHIMDRKTKMFFIQPGETIDEENYKQINFRRLSLTDELIENFDQHLALYNDVILKVEKAKQEAENIYKKQKDRLKHGDELPYGVRKMVKVYIAKKRKVQVGDKMAGRHGNKGVISRISPLEDMPFMNDGTPVDIVLNPLGVPSRMNIGQIMETHLGLAAKVLGFFVETPVFDGAKMTDIRSQMEKAELPLDGKHVLYDGKTGERFKERVTVGIIYMMKLNHLVADKMHARSTGPYSLITQQPLGGKAQHGGQRLGEMEVWALESYGAAHLLEEMLTIKSDDVDGRTNAFKAITAGQNIPAPGVPESFNVLVSELKSLCFDIEFLKEQDV